MNSKTEIKNLIEKIACDINLIDANEPEEIKQLYGLFAKVNSEVEKITDIPSELLKELRNAGNDSVEILQKIVDSEADDIDKCISEVSRQVCLLQSLVDKCSVEEQDEELKSEYKSAVAESSENVSQAAICQDDIELLQDFIGEASEHIESAESALLELETQPDNEELINKIFRAFHTIKGMAGFLDLEEIGTLAHASENLLDLIRKGQMVIGGSNTDIIFESIDMLKKMVRSLDEAIRTTLTIKSQQGLSELLEKLKTVLSGQDVSKERTVESKSKPISKLEDSVNKVQSQDNISTDPKQSIITEKKEQIETAVKTNTKASGDEKIKISMARLDNLVNMVGELVIAQSMVAEAISITSTGGSDIQRKVMHQSKIVRDLQELAMSMRMVPLEGVFQKMTRLVRDLSKKADKKINFVTTGGDTELDRNIIDRIADPLVHMIRNSVDHGIESVEQRIEAGKDPTGDVYLSAFHQAGSIVIEIKDDGKGLDKERILNKAVENGLVGPEQSLPDEKIFELIFHPGLSTAQKVTDVSGRGVGMDVVRKNIEALQGRIDITSTAGKGTIFSIRLPLTLAIIDGQIVRVGSQRYIIPINSIVRSLRPAKEQISSVQNKGEMVLIRKELLSLIRLYEIFETVPSFTNPTQALLVVVEEDGKKCCLLVDELLGQQQVVIKNLGSAMGRIKGVSGCSIMGDGKINLILDVPGLVELARS